MGGLGEQAGGQKYTGPTKIGWRLEKYDKDQPSGKPGNPAAQYGVEWYAPGIDTATLLTKGDMILVSYKVDNKHELAFNLAIEHTMQEIGRLYDANAGNKINGLAVRDIFLMDKEQMQLNNVTYDTNFTKL